MWISAPNAGDDEHHHDRELVDQQIDADREAADRYPVEDIDYRCPSVVLAVAFDAEKLEERDHAEQRTQCQ